MEQPRPVTQQNRFPVWLRLCMAASVAWAAQLHYGLPAADRGAGLTDLLVCVGAFLLLTECGRVVAGRGVRVRACVTAAIFTFLLAACGEWFHALRYARFTDPVLYTLYYLNAFVGTFLALEQALVWLFDRGMRVTLPGTAAVERARVRRTFLVTFALCAAVYFVFLLNQYPGSMESDHMRQLLHLLEGKYDNRNPLVNSLTVFGCVRLVQALGGSMNAGVFLYSIVQLLLMAAVFAFGTSLTARAGFPKWVTRLTACFYAFVPYNIFYSYGMWKDSFFAAWLLLTIFAVWSVLSRERAGERVRRLDWALVAIAALMASLSRNSGWSALLVWSPCLWFMLKPFSARKALTLLVSGAVALSLLVQGPLFSALGVEKTADSVTAMCVPLQQIGTVLVEQKALSPEQEKLIGEIVSISDVREQFDPACADPMKDLVYPRIDRLDANLGAYARLWLKLGLTYPLTYARAYLRLVRMYIDPNVSSEVVYKWVYPNDFGVYRDPKLLPALDFGYYESWLEWPVLNLLKRPGAILWCVAILWQLCALRKNRRARLFYVPLLAVVGGLAFTLPVALFRYVYSLAACLPFLLLWPFWPMEKETDAESPAPAE